MPKLREKAKIRGWGRGGWKGQANFYYTGSKHTKINCTLHVKVILHNVPPLYTIWSQYVTFFRWETAQVAIPLNNLFWTFDAFRKFCTKKCYIIFCQYYFPGFARKKVKPCRKMLAVSVFKVEDFKAEVRKFMRKKIDGDKLATTMTNGSE
jgi:hypothetical protein